VIPVQNVYYMLSYAFKTLNEQGYRSIETEQFHNVADLCAAILCKGLSIQIKRGLGKEYILQTDALSSPRGRIEVSESIKNLTMIKQQLVCSYDDFSINSYMNRIIKTSMELLLRSKVAAPRKKEIRKLLVFLGEVETIDVHAINWNIQYNRNNQTYRMLISICYLVIKGLLQTQSDGSTKLMDFFDEQRMCHLYEKFILEYYRQEYDDISSNALQIPWGVDDGYIEMLPVMQTDITLSRGDKTLIIDAKYYSHTLQQQFDKYSIHSGNLYQIFTYVKNKEIELSDKEHVKVAGMLLYAKTDEEIYPNNKYKMSGNDIEVRTLDLSVDFIDIKKQLDEIAQDYLGIEKSA